jgi:hypothetical protein
MLPKTLEIIILRLTIPSLFIRQKQIPLLKSMNVKDIFMSLNIIFLILANLPTLFFSFI